MMHLSARRRVELALPANLMHRMVTQCVSEDIRTDDDRNAIACLQRAAMEPMQGLTRDEAWRLACRVERAAGIVMDELRGHAHATAFLALTLWLKALLDDGVLELVKGSDFDQAMDAILATMEDAPDIMAQVDRSATKAARRIDERLRREGYYPRLLGVAAE